MPKKPKKKSKKPTKTFKQKPIADTFPLQVLKRIAITMSLIASIVIPGKLILDGYSKINRKPSSAHATVELTTPITLEVSDYPLSDGTPAPTHSARSVIVQDYDSKVILYEESPDMPLIPASTTKIMTALIAIENYPSLQQTVRIKNEHLAVGHSMGLLPNEVITIENLLYGVLVESGNDAAFALANNYPGGYDAFITLMNKRARELSLSSTHYLNPSGVEQVGHQTTVRDLAVLSAYASENPIFNKIMSTKSVTVKDTTGEIVHELANTNELLGTLEGVIGIKTGWTENAGECLVTLTERNGRKIITVVLGSSNRFLDSRNIIEWAFAHHSWQDLGIEL